MDIQYKGKKIPMRVSYYALKKFQEETGETIDKINDNIGFIEILVWHAIVAGYKHEGKEPEVSREDVEWILDDNINIVTDQISRSEAKTKKK